MRRECRQQGDIRAEPPHIGHYRDYPSLPGYQSLPGAVEAQGIVAREMSE